VTVELLHPENALVQPNFLENLVTHQAKKIWLVTIGASFGLPICTDSWKGRGASRGNPNGGAEKCHLFMVEFFFFFKKTHFYLPCQRIVVEVDLTLLNQINGT